MPDGAEALFHSGTNAALFKEISSCPCRTGSETTADSEVKEKYIVNTFPGTGSGRTGCQPVFPFIAAMVMVSFFLISGASVCAYGVEYASFSWHANPPEDNVIGYRLYYASESRFNLDQTLKSDFSYDYYIDFVESKRCVDDGTDADCQDLSDTDFQCFNLYGDTPLCTVYQLRGMQFFAMTAYNAQAESDFTPELSVRFDGAGPRETGVLSAISTLLGEKKK